MPVLVPVPVPVPVLMLVRTSTSASASSSASTSAGTKWQFRCTDSPGVSAMAPHQSEGLGGQAEAESTPWMGGQGAVNPLKVCSV